METIYFGGGTPSLLSKSEISSLLSKIYKVHQVASKPEITLEANPDDLSKKKLAELKDTLINRLSIGIQSFFEADLQFMNRAHTAKEALHCIRAAQDAGFSNLTIDLIYGTPTTTNAMWEENIRTALSLNIPHVSAYCLTVEPNTALAHFVKTEKAPPVNEEKAAQQFEVLINCLKSAGYEHYEISNFALPEQYARHNSNYWLGEKYLGIGPSAHSFDGCSRQWNVAHNRQYIRAINSNQPYFEKEVIDTKTRYNEYILTGMRTKWGCDLEKIEHIGGDSFKQHFIKNVQPYLNQQLVRQKNNNFTLTDTGKLLADRIAMELFKD